MALGRIFIAACVAVAVAASADPACSGTAGPCSAEGQQSVADTHTVVVEGRNKSTSKYINRELSWLAFNERVIAEAESTRHPLLERVRFLSISMSNLDEFYMVRVAGLTQLARGGVGTKSVDGLTPAQQLTRINSACKTLLHDQQALWRQMRQELPVQAGIDIIRNTKEELDEADRLHLKQFFDNELWPQLTPQSVDPAHPFPFIANRGMGLMFTLQRSASNAKNAARKLMQQGRWQVPAGTDDDKAAPPPDMQAIVLIPPSLPRFVRLPDRGQASTGAQGNGRGQGAQRASAAQVRPEQGEVGLSRLRFILIEDVISEYMGAFFPDYVVREKGMFRILRDSEVEVDDEAVDLVRMFETALKRRRKGVVILLAVDATMPAELRQFLTDRLRVEPSQVVVIDGLVGLADIKQLITDDRRSLQFPPFKPRFPERIGQFGGDLFAAIRAKDLVVHHPFETFDVVLQFLRQAARDPDVISIKQTLYRTSHDSPIVKELIEAAESGKTVTALIELKARFDEEANIRWAKDMERAGVQVVYGFVELKTHAKVALVMRREKDGLRPYVHFGTGNYHPYTAKIYTDLSLFTADAALCRDANRLFNFMTSLRKPYDLEEIAVAPVNLRTAIETHIRMEIANAKEGHPAAIWAKMNALVDSSMINLLYQASEAGVNITLVVRGICALRPGVPGLSSRIVVKSIVGRFLEHSRVVAFANKHALPSPHANVYISSADWMTRNLDWRVEALVPVENPTVHTQILKEILAKNIEDVVNSWILTPSGEYRRAADPELHGWESAEAARVANWTAPLPSWGGDAHAYFITHESLSGRGARSRRDLYDEQHHHHHGGREAGRHEASLEPPHNQGYPEYEDEEEEAGVEAGLEAGLEADGEHIVSRARLSSFEEGM